MSQTELSRDPETRHVVEPQLDDDGKPHCPDCSRYVGASKSGGKPLPGQDASAFGWSCDECNNTIPSNCCGPTAPMFNGSMGGLEVTFRDGHARYVPVPKRYLGGEQA